MPAPSFAKPPARVAARQVYLLLKGGSILSLPGRVPTAAQLRGAVAWCEEGGPWIRAGESAPPALHAVPWRCHHAFCPRPALTDRCPWWIDHNLHVHCGRMVRFDDRPRLYEGGPDDPPLINPLCHSEAARPVRLASGIILETAP